MTPEGRKKCSDTARATWARAGQHELMSAVHKAAWTPAMRKAQSKRKKKLFADNPGKRKQEMNTPEAKANCAAAAKETFWRQDAETRLRMMQAMNARKQSSTS